jgi:uncharacterized protein (DUF1499 family)
MAIIKFILILVVLIVFLAGLTLYSNDANLFQSPGIGQRLSIFLKTNVAETSDDHVLEELRTPVFDIGAESLQKRVLNAATALRWDVVSQDSENQNMSMIVRSPVFLFEDDVFIQVQFINTRKSSLHIRSSSRKGRADFAANSGHIQALIAKIMHK